MAAVEAWWVDGPRVSVSEIARRADVSKAGLYRQFGDEDGLMAAALDRYRTEVLVPRFEAMATDEPFGVVLDRLVGLATGGADLPDGCLLANLRADPDRLGPETRQRVAAVSEEQRHAFRGWFRRASQRGETTTDVDPELAGSLLDAQLTYALLRTGWGEDPDAVRAQTRLALRTLVPGG